MKFMIMLKQLIGLILTRILVPLTLYNIDIINYLLRRI